MYFFVLSLCQMSSFFWFNVFDLSTATSEAQIVLLLCHWWCWSLCSSLSSSVFHRFTFFIFSVYFLLFVWSSDLLICCFCSYNILIFYIYIWTLKVFKPIFYEDFGLANGKYSKFQCFNIIFNISTALHQSFSNQLIISHFKSI